MVDQYKVVVVICEDEETQQQLISLMSGCGEMEGSCVLDGISINEDRKIYKKNVDFINTEAIDSELTVKDYLIFYTMVSANYHKDILEEVTKLFYEIHKEDIMDKKINELSEQNRIIVRCVAAHLKNVKLLLGKNLLEIKTEEEKKELLEFLQKYFVENSCYCILFEEHKKCADHMVNDVIQI